MILRLMLLALTLGCSSALWAQQCTAAEKKQCESSCSDFTGGKYRICVNDCERRCGTNGGGGGGGNSTDWGVLPYDVVWKNEDLNGLPLNPHWWKQDEPDNPGLPSQKDPGGCSTPWQYPCTSDSVTIPPLTTDFENPLTFGCQFSGPLGHHADWFTVAYEGSASWDEHAIDGDDNINVSRPDKAAYTAQNPDHIHTEFSNYETIGSFSSPWWKGFGDAIGNGSAKSMIENDDAIEIGLLGLDCAHSCGSELHPVYALALHVKDDPNDDTWAYFGRDLGGEGFCAPDLIPAPQLFSKIYLQLPWRGGVLPPTVLPTSTWEKPYWAGDDVQVKTFPIFRGPRGVGYVVEIDLGDNEATTIVDGELHLHWPGIVNKESLAVAKKPKRSPVKENPLTPDEPENRFATFVNGLSPDVRAQVNQAMSEVPPPPRMIAFPSLSLDRPPVDFQPKVSAGSPARRQPLTAPNEVERSIAKKVGKIFHDNNVQPGQMKGK